MKKYFLFLLLFGILFSCSENVLEEEDDPQTSDKIAYDPEIENLLSSNCTGCHGGSNPRAGIDLTTYANARLHVESGKVLAAMTNQGNPMPPSGLLPSSKTDLIEKWIKDGYLEK